MKRQNIIGKWQVLFERYDTLTIFADPKLRLTFERHFKFHYEHAQVKDKDIDISNVIKSSLRKVKQFLDKHGIKRKSKISLTVVTDQTANNIVVKNINGGSVTHHEIHKFVKTDGTIGIIYFRKFYHTEFTIKRDMFVWILNGEKMILKDDTERLLCTSQHI